MNSEDIHAQGHFVCDLRESPKPTPKSNDGMVRAIHYYIGDDNFQSNMQSGQARAIVSEISRDAGDLHSILLDSGADAAVFPSEFAECGVETDEHSACLHDAQGREIPFHSMKGVEVHLLDQSGKLVGLRERVAISPHVTRPILCYGRLLQAGWGINPAEQTLTHSAGVRAPIELQNMLKVGSE